MIEGFSLKSEDVRWLKDAVIKMKKESDWGKLS